MRLIKTNLFLSLVLTLCGAASPRLLWARQNHLSHYEYTQIHMGVQVRIRVYAPDKETAERACIAAFRRFAQLEEIMSDYRPSSELMRLCKMSGGAPVKISPELFFVLERAQETSRRSGGAFDVTVAPLVLLWRQARKTNLPPRPEAIFEAKRRTGWRNLVLDSERRTAQLLLPNMRIDLGGIAKGYACDEAQNVLRRHGIRSALVEAGGDIVVSEPPPGRPGWRIEVVHPDPKMRLHVLELANAAISSSGDSDQFVIFGGKRYSHILDPKTGMGLTNQLAVTVIAPQGVTSDALSKVMSVLGAERGARLARTYAGVRVSVRKVWDAKPNAEYEPLFPLPSLP